ncbi:MAG TPA: type II toxin-antitoxin system MqsA family antitoxin [Hyphomicrobiaceae bacterium]|nr:type II toxin-antitoxin system MqsA family antitoxin [Hyphomicrobiaceae bacterium]
MSEESAIRCAHCNSSDVHSTKVRSAFWHDDRLVVVEDVPALVCGACHEQFYDDQTMVVLDLMRGDGFPPEKARRELRASVFSFQDRLAARRTP